MKKIANIYMVLALSFLYLPILIMMVYSFNESKSYAVFSGFTLKWYVELFQNEDLLNALFLSLWLAVVSAVIATILGTLASVGISSMKKGSRAFVLNVSYLPVINPEIVTGISLMLLFVVFKSAIPYQIFGIPTLLVAHITFCLPYVILSVMPKLRQMDYSIVEAALDLGCSPKKAFFKVVIPEISPGIISGFLIALTFSIDDFIISYFTSGTTQTLPIAIYSMTRKRVSPEINALSTVIFVVVMVILLVMNYRSIRSEKKKNIRI